MRRASFSADTRRVRAAPCGARGDRVTGVGAEAGAHIVAMMALNPAFLDAAGVKRQYVRGVVAISGVYRCAAARVCERV